MEQPTLMTTMRKFVSAGEQAGFTVEQMIQLLQTGATVETLLSMIESRLFAIPAMPNPSRWVM